MKPVELDRSKIDLLRTKMQFIKTFPVAATRMICGGCCGGVSKRSNSYVSIKRAIAYASDERVGVVKELLGADKLSIRLPSVTGMSVILR